MASYSLTRQALLHGHITTDEDRARIAALNKEKARRRAEREASTAERAARQPQIDARRAAGKARDAALLALSIGARLTLREYVATCQVGMLKQRLARDYGAYFSVKAIAGEGVRFERIDPPYAEPATDNPNGDIL